MFKKLKLKTTLTVQIHYNLQNCPNYYSEVRLVNLVYLLLSLLLKNFKKIKRFIIFKKLNKVKTQSFLTISEF